MLDDDEIKDSLIINKDIQKACEELIKLSNDRAALIILPF